MKVKIMNLSDFQYHHMGIPTTEPKPDERYSPTYKMYTTKGDNPFRIQWHRFEPDCPLHPLIKSQPHVAFKVDSLEKAIEGQVLLLGPYEPIAGFKVAMVEVEGAPVELIETTLTEDQIWNSDHKGSEIYPDEPNQ
ncbi:hypothetical protein [Vibrio marisflavi]|uniref:Uncharacterized protein n=1 Tax=Vibrio marisflavi CECT 7928 TaxID=634439 RepID=A0ABM9A5A2_9VIBR|nr:hypothetical protein [Vibrio marisflavi]CAH0540199.1 hypothetical protein VMF7928_02671 [Vibrio marisflavi CECT 7928]